METENKPLIISFALWRLPEQIIIAGEAREGVITRRLRRGVGARDGSFKVVAGVAKREG